MEPPAPPVAAGPLPISDPLRELLGLVATLAVRVPSRADELTAAPRPIGLVELAEIEQQLGVALPFDVLVIAALAIPIFSRATGISIDELTANHVEADAATWRAIATAEAGAMHPDFEPSDTDQGVSGLTLHVGRRAARTGDPSILVVDEQDPDAARPRRLSAYLRERLATRYAEHWQAASREPVAAPAWALTIVDDRPPPLAIAVTHPTFGAGTIVKLLEGGKVEVAFATGTKTLLRRFVRDA
jgi:hypothetical protein